MVATHKDYIPQGLFPILRDEKYENMFQLKLIPIYMLRWDSKRNGAYKEGILLKFQLTIITTI